MVWTDEGEKGKWQCHAGGVEKLATLHRNGRRITYVERSVRLREANPYSLGLNLTLGAFAVDFAALLASEVAPTSLIIALFSHTIILVAVVLCTFYNQAARPYEVWFIRLTAMAAIVLGVSAAAIAVLGVVWSQT